VTYYDTLGVAPSADQAEIRRAYLAVARRDHPDKGEGLTERDVSDASARMRAANEAWAVLGDASAKSRYDAELAGRAPSDGPTVLNRKPDRPFVPFDADDDDDSWRYEPDVGDPRTAPGRRLLMVPIVLIALTILSGAAGMLLDDGRFTGVALILAGLAVASFVMVLMVTLTRAAKFERG
jgi:hypothetical protein